MDSPEAWFEAIRKRNLTIYTYYEELAEDILRGYQIFKKYLMIFEDLLRTLLNRFKPRSSGDIAAAT